MINEINLSNNKLGDEFKTRNGQTVTLVYSYILDNTLFYVVTIGNPVYFSYPVYDNGKVNLGIEGDFDLIEQVTGNIPMPNPYSFEQQMSKQNEMHGSLMNKLMDQVGDLSKERRLDRREHIAIALIKAHDKYSTIEQDIDFIEKAITQDGN